MRHKLYKAISKVQENVVLSGDVELNPSYTNINLKGTKPKNMPRMSKHRRKHKSTPYFHHLKGTSHHKNCIVDAIDEHDQMFFKICGLGRKRFKILNHYKTSAEISINFHSQLLFTVLMVSISMMFFQISTTSLKRALVL